MSFTIQDLEEHLTCTVCMEIKMKYPATCPAGHLTCMDCRLKLVSHRCPACQNPSLDSNGLDTFVKALSKKLPATCEFKGCEFKGSRAQVERHSPTCSLRPYVCPCPTVAGACKHQAATWDEMTQHLKATHSAICVENRAGYGFAKRFAQAASDKGCTDTKRILVVWTDRVVVWFDAMSSASVLSVHACSFERKASTAVVDVTIKLTGGKLANASFTPGPELPANTLVISGRFLCLSLSNQWYTGGGMSGSVTVSLPAAEAAVEKKKKGTKRKGSAKGSSSAKRRKVKA